MPTNRSYTTLGIVLAVSITSLAALALSARRGLAEGPPSGAALLGHWIFDGDTPIPDESSHDNDGTAENIDFVYDDELGRTVGEFNGSSSYVWFDADPQPCAVTTGLTFGAIVRPGFDEIPDARDRMRVVARRHGTTWGYMFDFQNVNGESVRARVVLRNETIHHANSGELSESDIWYEIVACWEATEPASAATVYVDGSAEGGSNSGAPEFDEVDSSDADFLIGAAYESFGLQNYFKGRIAEVKIYGGVVDPEDVFP